MGGRSGPHRDEYLYTTDPTLAPAEVVTRSCGRWNIGTTFPEAREYLGVETTRGRCANTVTRAAPCLFGLYPAVALLYEATPAGFRSGGVAWPGKAPPTFFDALTVIRRRMGAGGVLAQAGDRAVRQKLPAAVQELLLTTPAPAYRR